MAAQQVSTAGENASLLNSARAVFRRSSGKATVLYFDGTSIKIAYPTSSNDSWGSETIKSLPTAGTILASVSGAIDSNDIIHISWMDDIGASSDLKYATYTCSTESFSSITSIVTDIGGDPTASSLYTAIAVDANNIPHIVYNEYPSIMGTATYVAMYTNKVGGSWNTAVQVNYVQSVGCSGLDIAIDLNNIPFIGLQAINAGVSWVNYVYIGNANNATSFTSQSLSTDGTSTYYYGSVCVDSSGNHWYTYGYLNGSTYRIYLRKHIFSDSWATWSSTYNTGYVVATYSRISIIPVASTIYVFFEDNANNDISYLTYDGSSWSSINVLETGTYNTAIAKWGFWVDNDSTGTLITKLVIVAPNDYGLAVLYTGSNTGHGQSFENTGTFYLYSVGFGMRKIGSPTGNCYVKLYNHSGTFGSTSAPTGTALATSDAVDVTTFSTATYGEVKFFKFSTPYLLTAQYYVLTVEYSGGDASNYCAVLTTTSSISGNASNYSSSWSYTTGDLSLNLFLIKIKTPTELDYIFLDETATPDIFWNTLKMTTPYIPRIIIFDWIAWFIITYFTKFVLELPRIIDLSPSDYEILK